VRQDAARNIVFGVPATVGRESAPTVVLQGHLDRVCELRPSPLGSRARASVLASCCSLVARRRA